MKPSLLRHALVLGLLSAIGPFAIDMYLPALPAIGRALHAEPQAAQASLTAFFLALGLCQLVYGPLSDHIGRKAPLYAGLALFAAGSIGCALAPDVPTLVAFRFVEGVGACASMVVPRAIVRDLYTGADATRLTALLMLVFSVAPILAPLAGSALIALADWRAIFWVLLALALAAGMLVGLGLPESHPPEARHGGGPRQVLRHCARLLADRHFLGLAAVGAFAMASFFAWLSHSSYVLIAHYGLSPTQFSLCFGANAAALIGVAQFAGRLVARHGLPAVLRLGVTGHALAALALWLAFAAGFDALPLLLGGVFVAVGFLGLVNPTVGVLALEDHGALAGTAAALLGTVQMLTGAAVMGAISLLADDASAWPMVCAIAACATLAALLAHRTLRRSPPAVAATR